MSTKFSLPPLYPIIDSELHPYTLHFLLGELLRVRIALVQLREKRVSSCELLRITLEALETTQSHSLSIIVNDRIDIVYVAGAHGVHLGQQDLLVEDARELLGPD